MSDSENARRAHRIPRPWWWVGACGLLAAALLPVGATWMRRDGRARCALDGQEVDASYRVRLALAEGAEREFCCLLCAELWLERSGSTPRRIRVTDEPTGRPLDATAAHYVRSAVFSNAASGDRRHVFARRRDAAEHASAYRGRILEGPQRPFARYRAAGADRDPEVPGASGPSRGAESAPTK